MALKGSQIVTQAGKYALDRVQAVGPGDLTQNETKIYEVGNYESIGTVKDTAQVDLNIQSFDATCEFEATLVGKNPTTLSTTPGSNEIDFRNAIPLDIISPWKSRRGQFDITKGVVIPSLTLSSVTYNFGVSDSANQTFAMTGDSVFYVQGQPYYEEFAHTGSTATYTIGNTAQLYEDGADDVYILSVCLVNTTTGAYQRVYFDSDAVFGSPSASDTGYSNTSTQFRLPPSLADSGTATTYPTVRVTYGSATTTNYTQTGNNPSGQPIHVTSSVKPAAIRKENMDVFIGTTAATPTFSRMNSVQTMEATWSVTLQNDEELGNERYVASEYDVPEVSGTIGVKPIDSADLFFKLSQITGVPTNQIIGTTRTQPVPLEMRIKSPIDGSRLKTIYVPDARFSVPGYNAQANTTLETSFTWSSESGVMKVYNGSRT